MCARSLHQADFFYAPAPTQSFSFRAEASEQIADQWLCIVEQGRWWSFNSYSLWPSQANWENNSSSGLVRPWLQECVLRVFLNPPAPRTGGSEFSFGLYWVNLVLNVAVWCVNDTMQVCNYKGSATSTVNSAVAQGHTIQHCTIASLAFKFYQIKLHFSKRK